MLSSEFSSRGSMLRRIVLVNMNGSCVRQLSLRRISGQASVGKSSPSIVTTPLDTSTNRSSERAMELFPLWGCSSAAEQIRYCAWNLGRLTSQSCRQDRTFVSAGDLWKRPSLRGQSSAFFAFSACLFIHGNRQADAGLLV